MEPAPLSSPQSSRGWRETDRACSGNARPVVFLQHGLPRIVNAARAVPFLLACAFPAMAQDSVSWGQGVTFDVHLIPADGPHFAEVVGVNRTTVGVGSVTAAELSIDGLTVRVTVFHGPGAAPDRLTVIPPEGFIAVPEYIDIEEDDTGVIRVFRLADMVTG
jgi:hypothetical protein